MRQYGEGEEAAYEHAKALHEQYLAMRAAYVADNERYGVAAAAFNADRDAKARAGARGLAEIEALVREEGRR